jgi:hypothetical protein
METHEASGLKEPDVDSMATNPGPNTRSRMPTQRLTW